jgi:hypothetical protein
MRCRYRQEPTTSGKGRKRRRRASADPLRAKDPFGDHDLVLTWRLCRRANTAVFAPGGRQELQAAVDPVAGVGGPVAAGFAVRERIPIHRAGMRGRCSHGQRRCGQRSAVSAAPNTLRMCNGCPFKAERCAAQLLSVFSE